MKKWNSLDQTLTADGRTISLHEHDGAYAIHVDGAPLMSTRQHASEEKLAELACASLRARRRARVLIGGLGFGFTLKAALSCLAADANVVVAEITAAVIAWNSNPLYPLAAEAMADSRVIIIEQDVRNVIRNTSAGFDAILLDVDNGPAAISTGSNQGLYDDAGLRSASEALRPGGSIAVWSAAADPRFERRLARAGFSVEVQACRARPNAGSWHTIYLGRKSQRTGS